MAPVPPGVAGATIVVSSKGGHSCHGGHSWFNPGWEGRSVLPLQGGASSPCYAVAAFAASALRLYIICCPMARMLLTSQ